MDYLPQIYMVTIAYQGFGRRSRICRCCKRDKTKDCSKKLSRMNQLEREHQLDELALMAMRIIDRSLKPLLKVEPL